MIRRTVSTTSTRITSNISVNSVKMYRIYNPTNIVAYVTDENISAGQNITSVSTDYITIPANSSVLFNSGTAFGLWGQSVSGTVALEIVELW
jgi:hypothetical protein